MGFLDSLEESRLPVRFFIPLNNGGIQNDRSLSWLFSQSRPLRRMTCEETSALGLPVHCLDFFGAELRQLDGTGLVTNERRDGHERMSVVLGINNRPARVITIFASPVEVGDVSQNEDLFDGFHALLWDVG